MHHQFLFLGEYCKIKNHIYYYIWRYVIQNDGYFSTRNSYNHTVVLICYLSGYNTRQAMATLLYFLFCNLNDWNQQNENKVITHWMFCLKLQISGGHRSQIQTDNINTLNMWSSSCNQGFLFSSHCVELYLKTGVNSIFFKSLWELKPLCLFSVLGELYFIELFCYNVSKYSTYPYSWSHNTFLKVCFS